MSQNTPSTPPTVRELIISLQKLDPDMPVLVSTHYDNDIGYASEISLYESAAHPSGEGDFWDTFDVNDYDEDEIPDDSISAIVIQARG